MRRVTVTEKQQNAPDFNVRFLRINSHQKSAKFSLHFTLPFTHFVINFPFVFSLDLE